MPRSGGEGDQGELEGERRDDGGAQGKVKGSEVVFYNGKSLASSDRASLWMRRRLPAAAAVEHPKRHLKDWDHTGHIANPDSSHSE